MLLNSTPPFANIESEGFSFWIKVTPKASKNKIGNLAAGTYSKEVLKVYVTAPPADNLANKAVIEVLAEYLNCAKSSISIISGLTTREKKILVKT